LTFYFFIKDIINALKTANEYQKRFIIRPQTKIGNRNTAAGSIGTIINLGECLHSSVTPVHNHEYDISSVHPSHSRKTLNMKNSGRSTPEDGQYIVTFF
jgi:hypothetical protein